jgi:hypothetical protein
MCRAALDRQLGGRGDEQSYAVLELDQMLRLSVSLHNAGRATAVHRATASRMEECDVIEGLWGAALGGDIGAMIRRRYFKSKLARTKQGRPVRIRCRAHPAGSPDWRYWRGAVVVTQHGVRWRACWRRWRRADLTAATVLSTRMSTSVADGAREILDLDNTVCIDHLAVSPDAAPILKLVFAPK